MSGAPERSLYARGGAPMISRAARIHGVHSRQRAGACRAAWEPPGCSKGCPHIQTVPGGALCAHPGRVVRKPLCKPRGGFAPTSLLPPARFSHPLICPDQRARRPLVKTPPAGNPPSPTARPGRLVKPTPTTHPTQSRFTRLCGAPGTPPQGRLTLITPNFPECPLHTHNGE